MTTIFIVQHGEKERLPGDPGLTELGFAQATRTRMRFVDLDVSAVYASDLRRARETAAIIAAPLGLGVIVDARVRERMNWAGTESIDAFLAQWARATADRDFVPASGDSSRAAGERFRTAVIDIAANMSDRAVIVASHGGVAGDLLRTVLGDDAVPELADGVPACAITTLDVVGADITVRDIANVDHLKGAAWPVIAK
jgi:broad specificity phosphatase PhoE